MEHDKLHQHSGIVATVGCVCVCVCVSVCVYMCVCLHNCGQGASDIHMWCILLSGCMYGDLCSLCFILCMHVICTILILI